MVPIDFGDDWAFFYLDIAFWTTRLENFKMLICSVSEKNDLIFTKFALKCHTYDIDLHPKNEKNP